MDPLVGSLVLLPNIMLNLDNKVCGRRLGAEVPDRIIK